MSFFNGKYIHTKISKLLKISDDNFETQIIKEINDDIKEIFSNITRPGTDFGGVDENYYKENLEKFKNTIEKTKQLNVFDKLKNVFIFAFESIEEDMEDLESDAMADDYSKHVELRNQIAISLELPNITKKFFED